jgi:hypothetical protein
MLIQIISHTPLWVWALFAALLALGLSQRRARQVQPSRLLILPVVLLVLGLSSMAPGFAAQPWVGGAWLVAGAVTTWAGQGLPLPVGARWDPASQRLHLPGSWFPLVLILVVFSLRYSANVGLALHPAWRQDLAVQVPLALAFGALSGLFLGRAIGLRRLATMGHHGQLA